MEDKEKLWTKDFVLVIIINFLVFLNHLMILSTFPFLLSVWDIQTRYPAPALRHFRWLPCWHGRLWGGCWTPAAAGCCWVWG